MLNGWMLYPQVLQEASMYLKTWQDAMARSNVQLGWTNIGEKKTTWPSKYRDIDMEYVN